MERIILIKTLHVGKFIINYKRKKIKKLAIWKELCDLWSSDYRTHTTNKKNKKFHQKINKLFNKLNLSQKNYTINQLSGFKRN